MICRTILLATMASISNATTHRAVEVGPCREVDESDVAECIRSQQSIINTYDSNERDFEEHIDGLKAFSRVQGGGTPIFRIEWCGDYTGSWYEEAFSGRWTAEQQIFCQELSNDIRLINGSAKRALENYSNLEESYTSEQNTNRD